MFNGKKIGLSLENSSGIFQVAYFLIHKVFISLTILMLLSVLSSPPCNYHPYDPTATIASGRGRTACYFHAHTEGRVKKTPLLITYQDEMV